MEQHGETRNWLIDHASFLSSFRCESMGTLGARLPFQAFSDANERQSVVIIISIGLSRWDAVFGDDQLAAAETGRVVHHGCLLQLLCRSKRQRYPSI